ncbi:MAG: AAA family ATPase [Acidobacteriota bacterium]|nr:AAA family ATPase [Acidobacteriota bacterium]
MYKNFYGLKKNPFNVNPDPHYLYLTPQMRQSLDELTYGIETRKGLMLLTGEVGTGKTTLINHLLSWLAHQRARTAFIFNSHLDSQQLFDFILNDFEIPLTAASRENPLLAFNEWLLARYKAHELVVLIIDEAQGLRTHVLEDIRLLLNMETPNDKLLQIVLTGQPELEGKLRRLDLVQLQQRIALRCKTAPLTLEETYGYVENRLHTGGANSNDPIFTPHAIEAIHTFSRGIPRVINLLCENALINGYVEQARPIPESVVEDAARDLQFDEWRPLAPRLRAVDGVGAGENLPPLKDLQPGLHSILAKIQADADAAAAALSRSGTKSSPYLVSPAGSSRSVENVLQAHQEVLSSSSKKIAPVVVKPNVAASAPASSHLAPAHITPVSLASGFEISGRVRRGWVKFSPGKAALLRHLAAIRKAADSYNFENARDKFRDMDFRAAMKTVIAAARRLELDKVRRSGMSAVQRLELDKLRRSGIEAVRRLELDRRSRRFVRNLRVVGGDARELAAETIVPAAKAHAAKAKTHAATAWKTIRNSNAPVTSWWLRNMADEAYAKTFAVAACVCTFIYFIAARMDPALRSWQHPARTILTFAVLLLGILLLSAGVASLVQHRDKLRTDWSMLGSAIVRWLRAPIQPMHVRDFESLAGKVQSQRRL